MRWGEDGEGFADVVNDGIEITFRQRDCSGAGVTRLNRSLLKASAPNRYINLNLKPTNI